jgi:CHAT domain-containing protein/Tfp pilus assembly protein PilF
MLQIDLKLALPIPALISRHIRAMPVVRTAPANESCRRGKPLAMAYNTGIMRFARGMGALFACSWLLAQAPDQSTPAERGRRLMDDAAKLAEQRTGKAMEQAIDRYRQAAPLWHEVHDSAQEAKALEQIGVLSLRLGNFQAALDSLGAALPMFQAAGDKQEEQSALNNIGLVQSRLGNQRRAIELEEESLRLAREIGNRGEEAVVLNNLGLAYHEMGQERQAIGEFEKALAIQHELGNLASEGAAWSNLGAIHYTQGDLEESLEAFERALALRKLGHDRRGEANTIGKIAVLRHVFGQDEEALRLFEKALEIDREVGDRSEESTATMNMGSVLMAQGRYPQAVQTFDRAMRLQEQGGKTKDWGNQLSAKAVALSAMGQYQAAEKTLTDALAAQRSIGNRRGESDSLARMAALHLAKGSPGEGVQPAIEAARIASEIGERRPRAEALYRLARCQRAMGRERDALAAIDEALGLSEAVREGVPDYDLRAAFFSTVRDQYDLKVALQSALGDVAGAFETAEASRARSLYDVLRTRLAAGTPPETGKVSLNELDRELDPDTVVLEYSLGREASYVFVVSAGGARELPIEGRGKIEAVARKLYAAWSSHRDSQADCETLSRMLLGPVRNDIRGKRVVVVPDGALAYIPFDALFASPGRRLIQDNEVVAVVSLSSLKLMRDRTRNRAPASKLVAVFADPVFSGNDARVRPPFPAAAQPARSAELTSSAGDAGLADLQRLVSTRREATAIAALTSENQRWEALDFEARLSAVQDARLADFRIVHFATHGLMNSRDPRLSGLVFSLVDRQGRPQNGFLRADEVANLKLGADLVVLSACQTALGKELRGEGLLGLARAFMYAGAPRVIASLWRVADSATADLMSGFYQRLLASHAPASEALRTSKLRLMRNPLHAAPYYWAGFTLEGDWR